jgi:hypothetical protein
MFIAQIQYRFPPNKPFLSGIFMYIAKQLLQMMQENIIATAQNSKLIKQTSML